MVIMLISAAIAALALLIWVSRPSSDVSLPPSEAVVQAILSGEGGGLVRSMEWEALQDGVWDTRTVEISTAGPELRSTMAAVDTSIRNENERALQVGEARLADDRALLVITPWQIDLKKVTLWLFWQDVDGAEKTRSQSIFVHKADSSVANSIANGAMLYADVCASCHGVAGRGIPEVAPPLDSPRFFADRMAELNYQGDLRSFVKGAIAAGRPTSHGLYSSIMEAWDGAMGGQLNPDEVDDVTDFILNWHAAPTVSDGSPSAQPMVAGGSVAQGQALYGSLDCLGCHGWPGQGGITGPDLAGIAARDGEPIAGLNAEGNIRVSLLAPSAVIAENCPTGPCPDMMPRDYGARLSPYEIELLVRYMLTLVDEPDSERPAGAPPPLVGGLSTLLPSDGSSTSLERGRVLYENYCVACHGDRGQGALATGLTAVLLGEDPQRYARAATAQGVPGIMPAWDQALGGPLTDRDLDDLAAYVVQLLASNLR